MQNYRQTVLKKFLFHRISSIQSAIFQMRNDVHRKIAGANDAYIRLEANVIAEVDSSSFFLTHPKDRSTASFHRSNLRSRSSEVSRGWNLSIDKISWPESGLVFQTSIPSACPAEKRNKQNFN